MRSFYFTFTFLHNKNLFWLKANCNVYLRLFVSTKSSANIEVVGQMFGEGWLPKFWVP